MIGCGEKCIFPKTKNTNFLFYSLISQTNLLGPIMDLVKGSAEREVTKMKILYFIKI